jgi:hypothetical protein
MRSAAAMLLVLVTGYPVVPTRVVSPTRGFLIFFCLSSSAAAKEIIHLSPKVSINIGNSSFAVEFRIGKMCYVHERPRNLIAVCKPKRDVQSSHPH